MENKRETVSFLHHLKKRAWFEKMNGYTNYSYARQDQISLYVDRVRAHPVEIRYVPLPLLTAEMCMIAVVADGAYIRDIPARLRTPEICLEAIRSNPVAFYHVDRSMLTEEMCLALVEQDGMMVTVLPAALQTERVVAASREQVDAAKRADAMDANGLYPSSHRKRPMGVSKAAHAKMSRPDVDADMVEVDGTVVY